MALIICAECGKEISDKSFACINCGCPMDLLADNTICSKEEQNPIDVSYADINKFEDEIIKAMRASDYNKEKAVILLSEKIEKSVEICRVMLKKPFKDYIEKNINLRDIMEKSEHSKVRSIEILKKKTGISLLESKEIFDQVFENYENSNNHIKSNKSTSKQKITSETMKKCNSCQTVFTSNSNFCTHCNSLDTNLHTIKTTIADEKVADEIKCPKCKSIHITTKTKGFGLGNAVIGGLALGPVGLLGGVIGSNTIKLVCMKCGYEWDAGKK